MFAFSRYIGLTFVGVLFTLISVIFLPKSVFAVGLMDEFNYLQETWLTTSYAGKKNIQSYLNGYNASLIPRENLLVDPSSIFLDQPNIHFIRKGTASANRSDSGGLLSQISSDSGSILAMAVGTIAFLYVMPEEFSKWPQEKKDLSPNKLWERYDKNVSNGPVWDEDEWEVNYIGHPYFGAAYYTHAMNKDFTRLESLSYSFMMSTCLYEYGLEAFFEDPSIQDLIITPVVGSLFGEFFISLSDSIESNGNAVLGSQVLGSVCMFMLDPITATLKPVNYFNEKYAKLSMDAGIYTRSTVSDDMGGPGSFYDHRVGVEIAIRTNAFSN